MSGGLRWRVGDGRSIQIAKDPWLPTPRTFLPISRSEEMSLMVGVGGLWNMNILSMPLCKFGCPDHIIWHYTQNGMYTVKSGYLITQEMN